MKHDNTITTTLRKARKLIETGWARGAYHRKSGGRDCYCASGALLKATGHKLDGDRITYLPADREAYTEARFKLIEAIPYGVETRVLPYYNDEVLTRKPQALKWFDRAIALSKAAK
jgi:hypothetical protein